MLLKNAKLGREIRIELKINLIEIKFAVRRILTTIWVTFVKKNTEIQTLIKKLMAKYRFFNKLPQISHIHKNHTFFKYNCDFLDQLLLPYTFHGSSMKGILFFNFASCETLKAPRICSMISNPLLCKWCSYIIIFASIVR